MRIGDDFLPQNEKSRGTKRETGVEEITLIRYSLSTKLDIIKYPFTKGLTCISNSLTYLLRRLIFSETMSTELRQIPIFSISPVCHMVPEKYLLLSERLNE